MDLDIASNVTYRFQASTTLAPMVDPSQRVAVVTGANQGLGFGIVKGLCEQFDGYIYLTARDKKKGADAVKALKDMKVCKHPDKLRFHELNVLNEEHTDDFYYYLKKEHGGIDILVNNAAIAYKRSSTVPFAEQAEKTILTNYLAVVRTCVFLFPLLRRHGRVVNLSSSAGHLSQISNYELKKKLMEATSEKKLTDIMYGVMDTIKEHPKNHIKEGWPNSAYAISKIGVNLLTRIYQTKFDTEKGPQDKVINAVHPGYVATNMSSYMGNVNIFEAADLPIYCALLPPGISKPRGQLVWNDYSIVDIDSPTTPETDTDIAHYDIVEDIRHYANYTTVARFPPFARVLSREEALRRELELEDNIRASREEKADKREVRASREEKADKREVRASREEKADKRDKPASHGSQHVDDINLNDINPENPHKNQSARAARSVKDTPSHKNQSARAARSVKDTPTPSSLSYRTITRPTLPEDWVSFMMEEDERKMRCSTLPNCPRD